MNQFKILSFNIGGYQSVCQYSRHWNQRKKVCVAIIQKSSADIVGFQEVQMENRLTLDPFLSGYDSTYGLKTVGKKESEASYNPIYWKRSLFKKLDSGAFYLSRTPKVWSKSWDAKDVRSATWVRLLNPQTNSSLIYFNLHLDYRGSQSRVESSCLIISKLSILQEKNYDPIIVSGDFNERAWQPKDENIHAYPFPVLPEYLPLGTKVHDEFKKKGYKDAYIKAGNINRLDMNTYHDYYGIRFPPVALRIDWILTLDGQGSIQTRNYAVIKKVLPPVYASDHFPIMATFMPK